MHIVNVPDPPPQEPSFVLEPDVFNKVTLHWQYLPSCYKADAIVVTYSTGLLTYTKIVQAGMKTLEIDTLLPKSDYGVVLKIHYEGNKSSEAVVIFFTTYGLPGKYDYGDCNSCWFTILRT